MSNANPTPIPASPNYQLIRKKRLLEKIPFSKSTLHAKMAKGPYQDTTFPRPIYFPNSRIPYWREDAIDSWIALAERRSFQGNEAFGELGREPAPVSSSLTAPQAQPENPGVQPLPDNRDAVRGALCATSLDGRPKQISVVMRRKLAAMPIASTPIATTPIATTPIAQTPQEKRTEAVAAGDAAEFWTYTSEMEKPILGQPERSLPMPHEVTPVYGEYAGSTRTQHVALERPLASPMFPTGRL